MPVVSCATAVCVVLSRFVPGADSFHLHKEPEHITVLADGVHATELRGGLYDPVLYFKDSEGLSTACSMVPMLTSGCVMRGGGVTTDNQ